MNGCREVLIRPTDRRRPLARGWGQGLAGSRKAAESERGRGAFTALARPEDDCEAIHKAVSRDSHLFLS